VAEDEHFTIAAKFGVLANDFDETDLSASLLSAPGNGSVTLNADGSYTYTPAPDFNGQDSFTYTVTDEDGDTDTGTVNILVTPVNDAPVAVAYVGSHTGWDSAHIGDLIATDVDGDALSFAVDQAPANGSVTIYSDGSFEYTPDQFFFGTDSFTYIVSDGMGGTATATVTIDVAIDPSFIAGFVINGIDASDQSGTSVSFAGDINADGVDDLIIGAQRGDPNGVDSGESYVVFGRTDIHLNGPFNLSDLDGTNGFVLNGIDADDRTGFSVSSAGDINNDGLDDLLIGARFAGPNGILYAGESYVVFGGATVGSGGALNLSGLNGTNGFVVNGIDTLDISGHSVSAAGDVNNDGVDDFIIGAPMASPNGNMAAGESYVIFGGAGVGASGTLDLSSLNGTNGFVLNGIFADDRSGFSVSSAGDINNDGVDDLIIGAYWADPNGTVSGESYLVFGGANVGTTGTFNLSDLDGTNGFILNGADAFDESGYSVSFAGDINNDGVDDLAIGARLASPNGTQSGETYVILGGDGLHFTFYDQRDGQLDGQLDLSFFSLSV
jgi:VCBS repeat-containing protein